MYIIRWGLFKIGGNTFVGHLEWGPALIIIIIIICEERAALYYDVIRVYRLNLSIIK